MTARDLVDEVLNATPTAVPAPGDLITVKNGDEVTFVRPADSSNDVFVNFADGRYSVFHMSCSDDDMDGESTDDVQPQVPPYTNDCGKWEGDGKDNGDTFINAWILEGMVDSDGVLDCNVIDTIGLPPAVIIQ